MPDGRERGRLWVATELYYPEETSTAYILSKLGEGLAADQPVSVLCAQPNYERKGENAPARESVRGVSIVRVNHPRLDRNSIIGRTINVFIVALRIFARAVSELRSGDVVIVVTNPPLLPFAIYAAAVLRRASVVLLVHDLFPEAAILAGLLKPHGFLTALWRSATDWLFRRVARIVVIGRDAAELVAARVPDGMARVRVIPNWADVEDVRPSMPSDNPLLESLGLSGRFVLGYAGNMGRVHDIQLLIDAARAFRKTAPDVHMLFIGNGFKHAIVNAAANEPDANVTVLGPLHRSEQDVFLNACHVSVMALAPGMAGIGVPSRLYNVLAAGKPVIAAVDADSEPARVIREERIGLQTPPGDCAAFVRAVETVRCDPTFLAEAGARARRAAVERFSFPKTIAAYRSMLAELRSQTSSA